MALTLNEDYLPAVGDPDGGVATTEADCVSFFWLRPGAKRGFRLSSAAKKQPAAALRVRITSLRSVILMVE